MDLLPDFKDLLSALADSSAEYLVIGGWAVGFHAEPRFTKDLDLLIGQDPENLARVGKALEIFGAPPTTREDLRKLGPEEFMFFGVPPARVDLLRQVPGIIFQEAFARRDTATWSGVSVSLVSRADLIASKIAAGRERDLRDVRLLEKARPAKSSG